MPPRGEYYLNHSEASIYNNHTVCRRTHLHRADADNFSLNVAYYYVDDVLAYDETMRTK